MAKYIGKRLMYIIMVFFILSLMFFLLYNSIPGDRAKAQMGASAGKLTNEQYERRYQQIREKMGLDDPLPIRYAKWMGNILTGDFGYSTFYKKDVINVITEPMKNTVFINIFSTILALGITIPLGIYTAVKKYSPFDRFVQISTIVGYSTPSFILGLIMIFLFAVNWQIFPVSGMNSTNFSGTGWEFFVDRMYYLTLPLAVMTLSSLGGMTRFVRAAMIDALSMDYIRTARAKGLKEKVVIYSHAWRNALLPVITLIIGWFLTIFGGSIIIENMFALNGMGKVYYQGLQNQDYDLAMAVQLFYVIIGLVGNLLVDLSYGLVDPRIRITK
ncbi:ABC transporter permease [Alloiococcus sp. CFN-8]|uniref:ABC transporter permease n=1 Tax=Alloiococcus sp. CFN-8 TaxID=3416081 RepID=UPI003CF3D1A3